MKLWNGLNFFILFILFFFCVSARGWCLEEDQRFSELETYLELEMFDRAASLVDALRQDFPDDAHLEYLDGIIAYHNKQPAKAQAALLKFITQYPEVPDSYYILAEISLEQSDITRAKEYFTKYCELVPEDIDAYLRLSALSNTGSQAAIIKDGREDNRFVGKVGFYGGCLYTEEPGAMKLVNGSSCNWSAMGIDFVYPVDLRGKSVILEIKGKSGGEKVVLTFRNQFAEGYTPQMTIRPQTSLLPDWQRLKIDLEESNPQMDLSCVVHIGLEFGSSTVQNPVNSALFVKNIVIESP
ncbi:MAG: tetratricopeptide repeat protein [Candidatus Omnitrophota bacterium]